MSNQGSRFLRRCARAESMFLCGVKPESGDVGGQHHGAALVSGPTAVVTPKPPKSHRCVWRLRHCCLCIRIGPAEISDPAAAVSKRLRRALIRLPVVDHGDFLEGVLVASCLERSACDSAKYQSISASANRRPRSLSQSFGHVAEASEPDDAAARDVRSCFAVIPCRMSAKHCPRCWGRLVALGRSTLSNF